MKEPLDQTTTADRPGAVRTVFREAVLVTVVGGILALAANHYSPRGLALTRNYFPEGIGSAMRGVPDAGTNGKALSSASSPAGSEKAKEWQWIDRPQAVQLFHDSHLKLGAIVFIDARDEEHYLGGHIPGAYEFDPYHPEKYFPAVMPACRAAAQIVVYCYGGDCDDSKSAAHLLREVGIPNGKLFIYAGGITDWSTNRQPVEIGARNSGSLSTTFQ
jgi:rhodanese-related sulfurtransferase